MPNGQFIVGDSSGGGGAIHDLDHQYLAQGDGGNGGSSHDRLQGSSYSDVIFGDGSGGGGAGYGFDYFGSGGKGGSGNDVLNGLGGNDILFGDGFNGSDGRHSDSSSYGSYGDGHGGLGGGGGGAGDPGGHGGLGGGGGESRYRREQGQGGGSDWVTGKDATVGYGGDGLAGGNGGYSTNPGWGGGGGIGSAGGSSEFIPPSYIYVNVDAAAADTPVHTFEDTNNGIFTLVHANLEAIAANTYPGTTSGTGAGNDMLDGGAGNDHYFGMGGSDTFIVDLADNDADDNIDTFWDFTPGEDKLRLLDNGVAMPSENIAALLEATGEFPGVLANDGAHLQLQMENGNRIVLKNMAATGLQASDFSYPAKKLSEDGSGYAHPVLTLTLLLILLLRQCCRRGVS